MSRPDELDTGPCCCCGRGDVRARNIVMMHLRAPVPGKGWGCLQCGLAMDGATYVACDDCAESGMPPVEVCLGSIDGKRRLPVDQLAAGAFDHDFSKHPEHHGSPA